MRSILPMNKLDEAKGFSMCTDDKQLSRMCLDEVSLHSIITYDNIKSFNSTTSRIHHHNTIKLLTV